MKPKPFRILSLWSLSYVLLFCSNFLVSTRSARAEGPGTLVRPGYDIIIIAGQSNAVGYGCGPFQDVSRESDRRISELLPDGSIRAAEEPLRHAPMKGAGGGKGFGMTFARLYAEKLPSERRVLLVPVALGATSIIQWDNVDEGIDFDPPAGANRLPMRFDSIELYDTLIKQARRALAAPLRENSQNRVAAILWHQGETDLMFMRFNDGQAHQKMSKLSDYSERVVALMSLLRKELGASSGAATCVSDCEPFPVILGEIGSYLPFDPLPRKTPTVLDFNRELQESARRIGHSSVARAADLLPGSAIGCSFGNDERFPDGDPYHFHAAAQVELGRRYFEAFANLGSRPAIRSPMRRR